MAILFHALGGDVFHHGTNQDIFYWLNYGFLPTVSLFLSLMLTLWLARKREFEIATLVFAIVAISHNQALWRSTVRYALPIFPFLGWMILAHDPVRFRRRVIFALALGFGFTIQVLYCRLFHVGAWAF